MDTDLPDGVAQSRRIAREQAQAFNRRIAGLLGHTVEQHHSESVSGGYYDALADAPSGEGCPTCGYDGLYTSDALPDYFNDDAAALEVIKAFDGVVSIEPARGGYFVQFGEARQWGNTFSVAVCFARLACEQSHQISHRKGSGEPEDEPAETRKLRTDLT